MVKLNSKTTELVKKKGVYKLHLKKEMKARGLTKRQVLAKPDIIEPPIERHMYVIKRQLNLREIEAEIK